MDLFTSLQFRRLPLQNRKSLAAPKPRTRFSNRRRRRGAQAGQPYIVNFSNCAGVAARHSLVLALQNDLHSWQLIL